MPATAITQNLMKISKLSEITGVARDAIRFYIREGLLPSPIKTKKNMAYYDESYVERIKLIKELQTKRFLPLSVIKQILTESEGKIGVDEIKTILELDGRLFRDIAATPEFEPMSLDELVGRTGLSVEEIEQLKTIGVLVLENKSGKEVFGEDSIRIAETWAKLRQIGFTEERGFSADLIKVHKDLIDVLVKKEIRIFVKRVTGRIPEDEAARMAEIGIQLLNTMMGLLRKQSMVRIIREYGPETP
jgi:DNA-binding transcriptional MerR regulator